MSAHDDILRHQEEEAMERFLEKHLQEVSSAPVFAYLARYGDAIQERVLRCQIEAENLAQSAFFGAAVARAAAGLEIMIRFFLMRPLVQGAFLSDEWANLLSRRILRGRTSEDRDMLPSVLKAWNIDIAAICLMDGTKLWDRIINFVWKARNEYVHAGADIPSSTAALAIECLKVMQENVIKPLAHSLGFTVQETGQWSVVLSKYDRSINPPSRHDTSSPFDET